MLPTTRPDPSLTGAAAIETATSVPSLRWRTVSKSLTDSPASTRANSSSLSARLSRRRHRQAAAAEHLLARPAEDALGGRVPQPDARIEPELHQRERRRVDQRLQALLLGLALGDVGVGDHVADDLAGSPTTGAAAIETATSVPSLRRRTVSKSLIVSPPGTRSNRSSLSFRRSGRAIGRPRRPSISARSRSSGNSAAQVSMAASLWPGPPGGSGPARAGRTAAWHDGGGHVHPRW